MPRVKRGTNRTDYRKKTLKRAKGFFLTKSKLNRSAQEAVEKSLKFGYVGLKRKKRDFRSLLIVRINAACRVNDISYSVFMDGDAWYDGAQCIRVDAGRIEEYRIGGGVRALADLNESGTAHRAQ